jgi:NAD(P)H dehydrogenase (quinone)
MMAHRAGSRLSGFEGVTMRVLVIYAHPRPDSFSAALRDAVLVALTGSGHSVDQRDLHAEAFDPVLSNEQRGLYFDESDNHRGLESHIESLRQAEALVLIYPTWWFGMPAILKGWFDRVWIPGVAFQLGGATALRRMLTRIKKIVIVTTYGSPWWMLWWVGWPDKRIVRRGLRPLCAKGCRIDWLSLTHMDADSAPRRERFLVQVRRHFAGWG